MTTTQISTLRPGLLVGMRSSLQGNVSYKAVTLEGDHVVPETGALRARWETERTIEDPAEHDRAIKARGKARGFITSVCTQSAFGLLCPEADSEKLTEAMRQARLVAEEFNLTAAVTRLSVNIIVGRIAADDVEAVRAINGEVLELLERMERGVRNLEVEAIREAANKAKALSSMLTPAASERAEAAIKAARSAARKIVAAGEAAAIEVDSVALETIRAGRLAFLDLGDDVEIQAPEATGRAIDLEMEEAVQVPPPAKPAGAGLFADIDI
jgi:hypothetical protein